MRPAPVRNTACLTSSRWLSGTWKHSLYTVSVLLLTIVEFRRERIQPVGLDGSADGRHVQLVETQIVQGIELSRQHFPATGQVVEIGAGKMAADRKSTRLNSSHVA